MVKKIMKQGLIRFPFYIVVFFLTYVGGMFVRRPKQPEFDTSWEEGRKRIFEKGIEHWENQCDVLRVKRQGIDVLEIGSGNGQWLIAFTRFANRVCGIEPNEKIYRYSLEKIKEYHVENMVEVKKAPAEHIPYGEREFDLVFCAGVFMFTRQDKALKEFNRVLRDNGQLLITANGLGYFVMYLLNGLRYFSVEKTAYGLKGMLNTWIKWSTGKQIGVCAVSHSEMKKKLARNGFELFDTRIWLSMELYPLEHLGFVTNYAFLSRKKLSSSSCVTSQNS